MIARGLSWGPGPNSERALDLSASKPYVGVSIIVALRSLSPAFRAGLSAVSLDFDAAGASPAARSISNEDDAVTIDERIPELSDKELKTLQSNAVRLEQTGIAKQKLEAARIIPLIDAELASRKAKAPPPRARKVAVKKAAKPKKAKAEVEEEAEEELA
jgi:hypothetical protein